MHKKVMSDIAPYPLFPWMDMSKLFSNFRRIHPGNLPILGPEYVGILRLPSSAVVRLQVHVHIHAVPYIRCCPGSL